MLWRKISERQARQVLLILTEECGLSVPDQQEATVFVQSIMGPRPETSIGRRLSRLSHVCPEYRFQGALGFGGKFRNNGNNNNTPYVDCYQEDETPERLAMIERANARLAELFKDS